MYIYNYFISNYVSFIYLKVYIFIYVYLTTLSTNPPTRNLHKNLSRSPPLNWTFPTIPSFPRALLRPLLLARCAGLELGNGVGGVSLVLRLVGASIKMVWELFLLESMQISTCTFPIIESLCFLCVHIHPPLHTYTHVFAYLLAQDIHIQSVAGRYIYLSYIPVINVYLHLFYFTQIFQPPKRPSTMCVFVAQIFATISFWLEEMVEECNDGTKGHAKTTV